MEMKFASVTQQASYTQHLSEVAGGDKRRRNPCRCRLTLSRPSYFFGHTMPAHKKLNSQCEVIRYIEKKSSPGIQREQAANKWKIPFYDPSHSFSLWGPCL